MIKNIKSQDKFDYLVKVVVIGDSAVGKTNLLLRFVDGVYKPTHVSTIGVDFKVKTMKIDDKKIKMQVWDTAGQEKYKHLTYTYYKGALGVILCFSITDRSSFTNVQNWIKSLVEVQTQDICKILIGNKVDCQKFERKVTKQQGEQLAKRYGMKYVECSAKQNININQIFINLGQQMKEKLLKVETNQKIILKPERPYTNSRCC